MTRRTTGSASRNGATGPTNLTGERIKNLFRWLARSHVQVSSPKLVSEYLHQHPEGIESARAAVKAVARLITAPHECELDLRVDQEIGYNYLCLVLRLEKYGDDLLDVLDDVQAAADKQMSSDDGRFLVTTDFCELAARA